MAFLVYQGTRRRPLMRLHSWWFLSGLLFLVLPLYRVLHRLRMVHPKMSLRREDHLLRAPRLLQEQQQQPPVAGNNQGNNRTTFLSTDFSWLVVAAQKFALHKQQIKLDRREHLHRLQQQHYVVGDYRQVMKFGFVMTELAQRVLSRQIASSHVMIVGSTTDMVQQWSRRAQQEGHETHVLTTNTTVDQWWQQHKPRWLLFSLWEEEPRFSSPLKAETFFTSGPTMTYIVTKVSVSTATLSYNNYTYQGIETIQLLLRHSYKIQVLQVSDYWLDETNRAFEPNDLVTHDNLYAFLHWGAQAAATSRYLLLGEEAEATFSAYLFCTQGLDLAIPSRRQYLTNKVYKPLFPGLEPARHANFISCPPQHKVLQVQFIEHQQIQVQCLGVDVTVRVLNDSRVMLWSNVENDLRASEAVCLRLNCSDFVDRLSVPSHQVDCATRILPKRLPPAKHQPNVLLLMLDPISRPQFEVSFPRTRAYLQSHNYTHFDRFTAVGNNSGPNQAALYAGIQSQSHDGISDKLTWLWDRLDRYATFKAEDGCVLNSNMIQSMQPNTTHGQALYKLFCFHFARPNCVGAKLSADYLLEHATQFIEAYNSTQTPWAAVVSLVDTHEDTQTLGGLVDPSVERFLKTHAAQPNTLVLILSDHGLHYGPYFQSSEGLRERSQPVLYIKLPHLMSEHKFFNENRNKWITAFDVHETILDVLGLASEAPLGSSLMRALPFRDFCYNVSAIPRSHCDYLENNTTKVHLDMPSPPSLLSFFADIPRDQRRKQRECPPITKPDALNVMQATNNTGCQCATSHRGWFNCTENPWQNRSHHSNEYFLMIECPGAPLHFELEVKRDEDLVSRIRERARQPVVRKSRLPNILFLEIDSVSTEYADRHLPKTRQLLRRFHVSPDSTCHNGLCGADFTRFAINGPNSVVNQLAAFSGCLATRLHESCFKDKPQIGHVCEDFSVDEYGMELIKFGPGKHVAYCPVNATDPFLYDIAKKEGYLTFFGEEFCYTGSPYVVQDNIFSLDPDFALHKMFCQLERRSLQNSESGNCVDVFRGAWKYGLGLDLLTQLWDIYGDTPKFAYLNAMAAHYYTARTSELALRSDYYDEYFARFLEHTFNRSDARETIVIVRSDHGFQGHISAVVDYSTQIEHRRPWTEIIVPDWIPIGQLVANRDRMATPYDLYATLRHIMTGDKGLCERCYDLLNEEIPPRRSCKDARVPLDFCMDSIPPPRFGCCNMFEDHQLSFCQDPTLGAPIHEDHIDYELGLRFIQENPEAQFPIPCDTQTSDPSLTTFDQVHRIWWKLDQLVSTLQGKSKVSGGIFLYPRQSFMFTSILQNLESKLDRDDLTMIRVCETGFGAGHSAALFLAASNKVQVITFDKFNRPYQHPAAEFLERTYGRQRINFIAGDTCETVPKFFANEKEPPCDFIHGSSFCATDMHDLLANARPRAVVTATAMSGLLDKSVYFGPQAQWRRLRDKGCLQDITCWKEEQRELDRSFVFAKAGTKMQHHFCVAINSGKCFSPLSNKFNGTDLDLNLEQLCSESSRVDVPQ